jgi:hypothetical protein
MSAGRKEPHWAITGLVWGAIMFLLIGLVLPWLKGEEITTRHILIGIPLWAAAGLAYGRTMLWWNARSKAGRSGEHTDG